MDQEQTIEQQADAIALAEARQEEAETEQAEAEDKEAETEDFEPAQKPSVGTVEFFLMIMLASVFWLLSLIPYLGILFSFLGTGSVLLWYKARHLNPPTLRITQFANAGNTAAKAEAWIKKIPGGSDFLFFLGVLLIEDTPIINLFPALPGLVLTIYLANRE